ncbi:protein disulfide isomerase [Colletotrichum truncatum]|uniref:Protein disulfide isomerase n=1 Tax=Colletotrichum truncatum TaxID=5467 RepID=A0ACC3Z238_COLTU|nr:protein disulfide isomerase [Colletotrichum truncatum]KAF6781707.1 protein disulfide isomerase [Colletotrichum truncatum]
MSLKVLLPLLALAGTGLGWQHKTDAEVRDAIATNEYSLIACKLYFHEALLFALSSRVLLTFCTVVGVTSANTRSDAVNALEPHWAAVEDAVPTALSVNCEVSSKLCADLDVASFPAIRFYRPDGTKHHYRGPRKGSEIGAFVNRMLRPTITPVEKETLSSFRSSDDVVLIAHFTLEETSLRDRYADLAERFRDRYAFGLTTIPESPGRIACYNNGMGAMHMSSELEEPDAMEKLAKKCAAPLVPRLTRRNEAEYMNAGKSLVYFFARVEQYLDAWTSAVVPLAKKYHQYITFVTVDLSEYPEMPAMFGLPNGIEDAVALQNPATGQVFPFTGEITIDAVEEFITDISEGKVEPWDGKTVLELVEVDEEEAEKNPETTQEESKPSTEKTEAKSEEQESKGHDEL